MHRRTFMSTAALSALGLSGCVGRLETDANRTTDSPTPSSATPTGTDAGGTGTNGTDTDGTDTDSTETDGGDEDEGTPTDGGNAFADVGVGRRAVEVSLAEAGAVSQVSLVHDDTVVLRERVGPDQSTVTVDLFASAFEYADGTYEGGYRAGDYRVVGYDGDARVAARDLSLTYDLSFDDVTVEEAPAADGAPTVNRLAFSVANDGDGPAQFLPAFYRDAQNATGTVTYTDDASGREEDVDLSMVPTGDGSVGQHWATPVEGDPDADDAHFLAPGERRRYLGPPLAGSHPVVGDADDPELSPASLDATVTVECVAGDLSTDETPADGAARERFAALRDGSLSVHAVDAYELAVSLSDPRVSGEWAYYGTASVEGRSEAGTWRRG